MVMDQWDLLINSYQDPPNLRNYGKAMQIATKLIKQDLALFEVEWLIDSLLHNPVNVLSVIPNKRNDESWYKNIGDSFKVLTDLVDGYGDVAEKYFEDIVQICLPYHHYDSMTRRYALVCLTAICKLSDIGAQNLSQHVDYLLNGTTSQAPVAVLVGTICEYHPEVITDINTIWRTYLIMLDNNKNTNTVQSSILQGIKGVLKHFGRDLPMMELDMFYDKLVQCLHLDKCKDLCISILGDHIDLFINRLSKDTNTRNAVKSECRVDRGHNKHVCQIYCAVFDELDTDAVMNIIQSEILPLLSSDRSHMKYLALRILWHVQNKRSISLGDVVDADIHTLEFELRSGVVSYDVAEAILWCIESKVPESDKLLQSSVLLYENLPKARVKEIVVHGILKAENRIRNDTIIYLTQQTVQEFDKYTKLWSMMFDTNKNKDTLVLEKSKFVFEDFLSYTVLVLDGFLEEETEVIPDKIKSLIKLYRQVSSLYREVEMNDFESNHPLLTRNKQIRIDLCRNEEELCQSCLDIIETDFCDNVNNILLALKVVFTRNDVEPRILILALKKLENVINNHNYLSDQYLLSDIIKNTENLRNRKDLTCKEGRVLQKDVLIFLGKYANLSNSLNMGLEENTLLIKLQELPLFLPNPLDGAKYKINLQNILHEALLHENTEVLMKILTVLCCNLSQRKEPIQQQILTLVIKSLTKVYCHSNDLTENDAVLKAVNAAVTYCDSIECVGMFINYIGQEISPGVRKMLSDLLQSLLSQDQGSSLNETIINTVAEHVVLMVGQKSQNSTIKRAGLNITEILLITLKENNDLSVKLLPNIIRVITQTLEIDADTTLSIATEILIEKIELFDQNTINNLMKDLIKILLKHSQDLTEDLTLKLFKKTVKIIFEFLFNIFDNLNIDKKEIIDYTFEVFDDNNDLIVLLYLMTEIKNMFHLNNDLCKEMIVYNDSFVLKKLFCMELKLYGNYVGMEMILIFIEEFVDLMLFYKSQETNEFMSKIIEKLTPGSVKNLQKRIKSCFTKYLSLIKNIPANVIFSYDSYCNKIPVKYITVHLEKESFKSEHATAVNSLKIMMDTFKDIETSNLTSETSILTDVKKYTKYWSRLLLQWFAKGYMKRYLKNEMSYLTDILTVAVKCHSLTELKGIMLEGHGLEGVSNENIGLEFVKFFIDVFIEVLLSKPFLLSVSDMAPCVVLLNDITLYAVKKKRPELYDSILDLVQELWPTYVHKTTFDQKHNLLSNLNSFPRKLPFYSEPMQWACGIITSESSKEEKAKVLTVLPGGKEYAQTYRSFASILPLKPLEWVVGASAVLTALFDDEMLDIVAKQAIGLNATEEWWLSSIERTIIESCRQNSRENAFDILYKRCWEGLSGTVCKRMLVPLLRYSSIQCCEKFLSTKIKELLGMLDRSIKVPTAHNSYKQLIVNYTRVFYILQIAFEKLPPHILESPHSLLYCELKTDKNWHLVRETCRLSVSLRKIVTRVDDSFHELYKNFHTALYNCISAAICVRRPNEQFYNMVFSEEAWSYIVDKKDLKLTLRSGFNQRTRREVTSIEIPTDVNLSMSMTLSRTRHFVNTLSENPLLYDLLTDNSYEPSQIEIELQVNELNSMDCSTTLTSLLCHAVSLTHMKWLDNVVSCLVGGAHCNVKYFLAQCISNSKVVLKIHKNVLAPALLKLIVDTCKGTLNSSHVDVLETITYWSFTPSEMSVMTEMSQVTELSNKVLSHLIHSCLECLERPTVYYRLLTVVKEVVKWGVVCQFDEFKKYFDDKTHYNPKVTEFLTLLTKAKCVQNVQEILVNLTGIFNSNLNIRLSKLSQLYGAALTAGGDPNEFIMRFRKVLDKKRKTDVAEYIRMLYYAQNENDKICDDIQYRTCLDLLTKLPTTEKLHCLKILTSYMNKLDSCEFNSLFEMVRSDSELQVSFDTQLVKMAVVGLKAQYPKSDPQFKRPKLSSSPIINNYDTRDPHFNKILSLVSNGVIVGDILNDITEILDENMGVRFIESFILSIYLPTLHKVNDESSQDLSVCLSTFLQLFLSGILCQERFKALKLSEKPLVLSITNATSRLISMSKSYQGSFSRFTGARQTNRQNTSDIDVEISLCSIVEDLLAFCKIKPSCAQELFLQLFKSILPQPGFDSQLIAKLINTILSKTVNELTPTVIEMSRIVIDEVLKDNCFEDSIKKLKFHTIGTEAEFHTRLLYEELKLRANDNEQFVLGLDNLYEDVCMGEDKTFCMEDIIDSFGKLSNWDDLSTHDKRLVVSELPVLWTDRQTTVRCIEEFQGGPYWLQKLISSSKQERENIIKWLRDVDKWPRKYFDISSVTEAVLYIEKQNAGNMFQCDIQKHECLVEWAARLMVRSSYLQSLTEDKTTNMMLSRSHELKWCERANEMAISKAVIDCVKRNLPDINNSECLPWIKQKVVALRTKGLERDERPLLCKALSNIETNMPQFKTVTAPEVLIDLSIITLRLHGDLKEYSKDKLDSTVQEVYNQHNIIDVDKNQLINKISYKKDTEQKLMKFYEIAIVHYDDPMLDLTDENARMTEMLNILEKVQHLEIDAILAIILNRVKKHNELNGNNAKRLLDLIEKNKNNLDEFSMQQIRIILSVLPSHVTNDFSFMREKDGNISKYKKCFQLVCDPEYLLVQYFDEMKKALERNELELWKKLYTKLKENIFENPYIGSDYVLLKKYKNMLKDINDKLSKSAYEALPLMVKCQKSLIPKTVNYVRLSQLCPTLVQDSSPDRDIALSRLIGLTNGVTVVKFHEQVQVITTSVRRPVIIKALLSNGQTKQVLHKSGAVMNYEASPQRVMQVASRLWSVQCRGYNVTPLSEDSALIEYLEDHETVRSLISSQCDIQNILNTTQRGADDSLICSIQDSLQVHNLLCDKVPVNCLRSSIELKSITLQDFIQKKQCFLESIASATVLTWLLGVGDRHLENMLYSIKDGGLCCIDWGEILQFGSRELPPARLTRNLLAVCDIKVLQSRITKLWSDLRDSYKLVLGVIEFSFTWMGSGFDDKLPYIESQLKGTKTTYDINKQIIQNSNKKYKEKYIALLDNVFVDLVKNNCYSVEEQVSCFLRHCTDQRILSVTRLGWQPWV